MEALPILEAENVVVAAADVVAWTSPYFPHTKALLLLTGVINTNFKN